MTPEQIAETQRLVREFKPKEAAVSKDNRGIEDRDTAVAEDRTGGVVQGRADQCS
jgi:hypothetical protein